MNATQIIYAVTISQVFIGLGGDAPRRGRARAFYRDGDNQQAVSLNDAKGCWFDHRDGAGGGVLDLIQRVLGCGRGGALRWLSDFTGIPLDGRRMTASERSNYGRASREADALAVRLADFAWGLELVIEDRLHRISELLNGHGVDPTIVLGGLHRQAYVLRKAAPEDIAATWREMRKTNPACVARMERIGRESREHAAKITNVVVELLAAGTMQEAA